MKDIILTRRSIRKYQSKEVPDADIKYLLEVGMSAPSAGNERPWQFVVIKDKKILNKIALIHPYSSMLPEVNAAIVVCGDLSLELNYGFWVQDCSAATENILIAANSRGLGTVWLGVYPVEERIVGVQNILDLPEHIIPLSIIPVGYPDEKYPIATRYDETRVHYDGWTL